MTTFFTEVRQPLVPRGEVKHSPLPPLLVAMTLVTGLVDAFSYLVLGHVFVANMTGNIVFLAFALAGAPGFSIPASLVALCSFVLGSFALPRRRLSGTRPLTLRKQLSVAHEYPALPRTLSGR